MVKDLLKKSQSVYFTVDLEDFTYDLCRSLGCMDSPKLRDIALFKSYENISNLLDQSQVEKKITFFCTGVMARRYPDLIRQISKDGHEIGCHGDYHDDINKMGVTDISYSLRKAKDDLQNISCQAVEGFRAPRFSLNNMDYKRLEVIATIFSYDSSLHFQTKEEFDLWKQNLPFDFTEYPVPWQPIYSNLFKFKTGGTYLKLFPRKLVKRAIAKSIMNGLTPIVYLHPYDLIYDYSMFVSWSELSGLNFSSRFYWFIRQSQWVGLFNSLQEKKLIKLFSECKNLGALRDFQLRTI